MVSLGRCASHEGNLQPRGSGDLWVPYIPSVSPICLSLTDMEDLILCHVHQPMYVMGACCLTYKIGFWLNFIHVEKPSMCYPSQQCSSGKSAEFQALAMVYPRFHILCVRMRSIFPNFGS